MLSELRQDQVLRSSDESDPETVAWLLKNIAEIDGAVARIAELEDAFRKLDEVATACGCDCRHSKQERFGARTVATIIRTQLRMLRL